MAASAQPKPTNVIPFAPRGDRRPPADAALPGTVSRLPVARMHHDWSGPSYHEAAIRDADPARRA